MKTNAPRNSAPHLQPPPATVTVVLTVAGILVVSILSFHPLPSPAEWREDLLHAGSTLFICALLYRLWLWRWQQQDTELQQATDKLRRSEAQKDLILAGSSEIIFQLDADGCLLDLNPAWETISGHAVGQTVGRPLFDFIRAADRQECQAEFAAAMEGREECRRELGIVTATGDLRLLEVHARPSGDGQGGATGLTGTMVDVSQRREAEERFRNTFEQAAVGIAHVGLDGTIAKANDRLCRILGVPAAGLRGRSIFDFAPGGDKDSLRQHYRHLLQGDASAAVLDVRCRRGDGSTVWLTLTSSLVTDADGAPNYFIDVMEDSTGRHDMEQALRQAEAQASRALDRLSFHMEHIPLGCIVTDGGGGISYWNQAATAIFGWTATETMGRNPFDLLVPLEFRSFVDGAWQRLLGGAGSDHALLESRHRDGSLLSCEWHGTPLPGAAGEHAGVLCLVSDVSERTRFEKTLETVTKGVAATVGTPFFISLAKHLCDALEMEIALVAELIPDHPGQVRTVGFCVDGSLRPPMDLDLAGTPCQNLAGRTLQVYEQGIQARFPAGHCLGMLGAESFAGVTLRNDIGAPIGILAVMGRLPMVRRQLTETMLQIFASRAAAELERRRTEKALHRSEERFAEIFNQDEDALALIQRNPYRLMATNAAAQRLFAADGEELSRWHPCRFLGRRLFVEMARRLRDNRGDGSFFMERAQHRRSDGTTITLSARLQLLHLGAEEVILCNVRDITDKVRLEEEIRTTQARLIHTNKMASLGLLVSSISHEVNNPNNYISVNAQTLTDVWRDAAPLLEERRQERGDFPLAGIPAGEMIPLTERLISGIAEGSRRISAIVGTMRDYVKTDASYIRSGFSLNRLIDNALAILWHLVRKNTDHLHLELAPDLPPLHGNPQQIEQVVMNLVVNALQALPDRSRGVVIATSLEREQEAIILTVSDEGQGMERQTLEHLAEPFFTTKGDRGGTGLGLYISRSILKEHGGTLSFESAPGKGTTATVTLPLRRCDEKGGSAPLPPPLY